MYPRRHSPPSSCIICMILSSRDPSPARFRRRAPSISVLQQCQDLSLVAQAPAAAPRRRGAPSFPIRTQRAHLCTPEGGRIFTFCPELRATVPIGVGNDGSIDPFPLYDSSSLKLRIIGSDRDELSSHIPDASSRSSIPSHSRSAGG